MKKKKILVVQGSLQAGGAEKATVSFLNTLPPERYEVDLMLSSRTGLFYKQVPGWVNIIDAPYPYNCLAHKPVDWRFYIKHSPFMWMKKVLRTYIAKHQSKLHLIQSLWKQWRDDIPVFDKEYDIAYGGQEGANNYYVIDHVKAKIKILWIHNDYEKLKYVDDFDRPYFKQASVVATMSPKARDILQKHFPESADHMWFLENITNGEMIRKMAMEDIDDKQFKLVEGLNLISVGRLAPVKNFERAIRAASIMKTQGLVFHWTIIGDGSLRNSLEALAKEMNVEDVLSFIGLRSNPYQYMRKSDMLVVTSNFEGRSIAIDEAQVLGIPVITTNYPTAKDAVIDGETGLICDMTPEAIASSIVRLYRDKALYAHICQSLEAKKEGNVQEIQRYFKAFGD